jgi:hypothetical protein
LVETNKERWNLSTSCFEYSAPHQTKNYNLGTMASSSVAKDAALLESVDLSSTTDLHRSNLMRMQVTELLEECQLDLQTRKWSGEAHEYLQLLSSVTSKMEIQQQKIKDQADKPVSVKIQGLTIEPIGTTKVPVGWTKKTGNAQVLPTFSLMLLLPADMFGSKDYLNYRYFDVSKTRAHHFFVSGQNESLLSSAVGSHDSMTAFHNIYVETKCRHAGSRSKVGRKIEKVGKYRIRLVQRDGPTSPFAARSAVKEESSEIPGSFARWNAVHQLDSKDPTSSQPLQH